MRKSCSFVQSILGSWHSRLTETFGPKSFAKPHKNPPPFFIYRATSNPPPYRSRHCWKLRIRHLSLVCQRAPPTEETVHGTTHQDVSSFMVSISQGATHFNIKSACQPTHQAAKGNDTWVRNQLISRPMIEIVILHPETREGSMVHLTTYKHSVITFSGSSNTYTTLGLQSIKLRPSSVNTVNQQEST